MLDPRLDRMISHDEIGIATARIAGAVVRSAFQPVYEARGDLLEPVAVEGFARPFVAGAAVPPRVFLSRLDDGERREAERACMVLHCRNLPNLAEPGIAHVVAHVVALDGFVLDADGKPDRGLLAEAGRGAARGSVGRLRSPCFVDAAGHALLAAALREQGMLVSLGGFGASGSVWEDYRATRPDVVHLDGPWFRRIASDEPALRLLAQLVKRLRDDGARVLVRGIETRTQLASAIAIGCDLFQGYALARPALVGTDIDLGPKSLNLEADIGSKIVTLFDR